MELGDGFDRRRWLRAMLLGAASVSLPACDTKRAGLPPGEWVGAGHERGHRLRDLKPDVVSVDAWHEVDVAIVGGGVAGLSAARQLIKSGIDDLVVLELEDVTGGTARPGTRDGWSFPWGAHYLPLPQPDNVALVELLRELNVLEPAANGAVLGREEMLCRDPQERLLVDGKWYEDLDVWHDAPDEELAEWRQWQAEIERWTKWRGEQGRRAFSLPTREASDAAEIRELDTLSMSQWLERHGWNSPRLRWLIDYACRDDYGMTIDQVSAWAGLFYFCARMPESEGRSQPLLTWPEGNGWLVKRLAEPLGTRLRTGMPVWAIRPGEEGERIAVVAGGGGEGRAVGYRARRVVCATPQFVAARMIAGYGSARAAAIRSIEYGSWLVANLFLRDRPRGRGFPLAWDNVSVTSKSLGYVVATHQLGIDHGPTVLTWYHAFCDDDPKAARQRLLEMTREEAAELVLVDMEGMHPEIRELTTRIDVMRWGHAMVRPRPGYRTSDARREAAEPWRGVHFAHSELSGVALFEEAFDQGRRAALEVVASLGN